MRDVGGEAEWGGRAGETVAVWCGYLFLEYSCVEVERGVWDEGDGGWLWGVVDNGDVRIV